PGGDTRSFVPTCPSLMRSVRLRAGQLAQYRPIRLRHEPTGVGELFDASTVRVHGEQLSAEHLRAQQVAVGVEDQPARIRILRDERDGATRTVCEQTSGSALSLADFTEGGQLVQVSTGSVDGEKLAARGRIGGNEGRTRRRGEVDALLVDV